MTFAGLQRKNGMIPQERPTVAKATAQARQGAGRAGFFATVGRSYAVDDTDGF